MTALKDHSRNAGLIRTARLRVGRPRGQTSARGRGSVSLGLLLSRRFFSHQLRLAGVLPNGLSIRARDLRRLSEQQLAVCLEAYDRSTGSAHFAPASQRGADAPPVQSEFSSDILDRVALKAQQENRMPRRAVDILSLHADIVHRYARFRVSKSRHWNFLSMVAAGLGLLPRPALVCDFERVADSLPGSARQRRSGPRYYGYAGVSGSGTFGEQKRRLFRRVPL